MASSSTLASFAAQTPAARLGPPRRRHARAVVKAASTTSSATGEGDATTGMSIQSSKNLRSVGSVGSVGDDQAAVTALKKRLLAAVAASRKPGADPFASKRHILDAVAALEASGAKKDDATGTSGAPFSDVSGRWSLVYSTNDDGGSLGPLAAVLDEDTFQRVSSQLYKLFFSFAPALAGSAETGAKGVSNEQIVDLAKGVVINNVDVALPWPFDGAVARVGVSGEVEAVDAEGREVTVTFTEWQVGPAGKAYDAGGAQPPGSLRLPLPRPRGFLKNTFCDDTLRLSRGGRGGVFITSRLPPASSSTSSGS